MYRKVGRMTLALVLIVVGGVLVIDNLQGTHMGGYLAALWPALLIFLGIEWLLASARVPQNERVRVDGGAIALLVVIALIASNLGGRIGPRRQQVGPFPIPTVPPIPAMPALPNPFGNASAETVQHRDYEGTPRNLQVVAGSAEVVVKPGDKLAVDLRVKAWGRDVQDAQQLAQAVQLDLTPGPDPTVRYVLPASGARWDLRLEIQVPAGVKLIVKSESGSIQAEQLDGPVDLSAASGSITVDSMTGNAVLTSTSGNIRAARIRGSLNASSTSGSITADGVGGTLSAQSSSGNIDITTAQIGGNYDLTATSGNVQLRLPDTAPVTLSAKSSSGLVSGPSWLIIGEGRNSGQGKNSEGTYTVTIRTSSGSITVRQSGQAGGQGA